MCVTRVCACLCACVLLCAMLCPAAVVADGEKRAEMSPVPFVLGSRYGRSPPRLLAPRNDRFFMGSRYGKRDGGGGEDVSAGPRGGGVRGAVGAAGAAGTLVCEHTGLLAFYRCRPLTDYRRNDDEPSLSEED